MVRALPFSALSVRSPSVKMALFLTTAVAWSGGGGAFAQAEEDAPRRNQVSQSWTLDTQVTYSDNFRRLPTSLDRLDIFQFFAPQETGCSVEAIGAGTCIDRVPVEVDKLDNTIFSVGLRGAALAERSRFSAIVSGGVRIGAYTNTDPIDDRLLATATPEAPVPVEFGTGTIGSTFGFADVDEVFVDPDIVASATWKAVDNLFYIDGSVLALEQTRGRNGQVGQRGIGQADEEIIFGGLSISPYLLRRMWGGSSVELRTRSTVVEVLDEQLERSENLILDGQDSDDVQLTNDSESNELLAQYSSGDIFSRFEFSVGGQYQTIKEDGSDLVGEVELDRTTFSADAAYEIGNAFSITAGIGHDEVDLEETSQLIIPAFTLDEEDIILNQQRSDELSGIFWDIGFEYIPSRVTEIRASVGERFGGTSLDVKATYRPSARITLNASANRQLNTGTQDFVGGALNAQNGAFAVIRRLADTQGNANQGLLDRALTFEGASFRDIQRGQFGIQAIDRYNLTARGNFRRTTVGANLTYTTAEQRQNRENEFWTLSFDASRQVTRRLSANANIRFTERDGALAFRNSSSIEGDELSTQDQYYGAGLAYRLGNNLSATAQVYHLQSEVIGTTSSDSGFDID
ncbi:MAG: hypothetical protein AAF723_03540, partial [Pseudomonadota bacterium]